MSECPNGRRVSTWRQTFRRLVWWTTKLAVLIALVTAVAQWVRDEYLDRQALATLATMPFDEPVKTGSIRK
jgi:hypothetical protein